MKQAVSCPITTWPPNRDTSSMHSIANYDVTVACGYVACP